MASYSTQRRLGETLFAHALLGDQRRNRRLAQLVDQLCTHPGGTLPEKLKSPKDLKALYRLCDCEQVTHAALMKAVRPATLAAVDAHDGVVLVIHDGTELDYSTRKSLSGQLGQVGRGLKRGYLCHNSLVVCPEGREVLGLVNQILHRRVQAPKKETLPQRRARASRESRLWLRGTEGLPADWRLVDVADQGADTFEFLEHEVHSGRRFVIRAHHARKCNAGAEPTAATHTVHELARSQPALGGTVVDVPAQRRHGRRAARQARRARLLISVTPLCVHPPHAKHGNHGDAPLPMWVVRVWEPHPPQGQKPIEWLLLTNEPVATLAEALRVIQWYQARWVVEEFHKAMKTGCAVEALQFKETARLEPMIALLSVVATTLLNLRAASQLPEARTRPATTVIAHDYVEMLSLWRFGKVQPLSVHEFFYALARMGGHQNRPSDKPPGWLVLWRGWTTLQAMVQGAAASKRRKCG